MSTGITAEIGFGSRVAMSWTTTVTYAGSPVSSAK